ncbi:transcription factor [Pseudozyma hubeiensis SY62]|uniref:Transcription factor n=1 Tax=Pseudozyma hubeiensis (strain SY62) TaxID=1305764 RepID=R9NZZ0_PSEHS|nr:transcription factor [Pseudozyma hubeiensis SY62]GAC94359.1 transcription factor [Pseudozyma hubeiensis SY62]
MAMALTALPLTVTPSSLVKGNVAAHAWTEPADTDEAAQCLVSMSSSNNSTSHTGKQSDVIASLATPTPARAPHSKPDRLSLACNPCRKRKVRCDAHQPKCHNCIRRGDVCVTSDPRKAGAPPAVRQKATRRHTGPSLSALQRAREVEQKEQRQLLLQSRRDQWSVGSTGTPDGIESELDDDEPVEQDQDDDVDLFGSDLVSDPIQDRQTQPISAASLQSPRSIGSSSTLHSSTPLVELVRSSSASLIRTRNRNNSSSNTGGDTELPTWVSRAYKEVSAAHAPSIDQLQTSTEHDEQQQPHSTVATPDVVINTDGSPNRFKVLGGSSLQYLFKFTDVCLASYGFDATAPLFRHGLTPSDDFVMPLFPTLPDLPAQRVLSHCIDIFFARVWPAFPALDRDAVQAEADLLLELQAEEPSTLPSTARPAESLQSKVRSSQVPGLVVLYAIICIGLHETSPADPVLEQVRRNAAPYLTACYSLHAHLTAMPYQSSVQALLLVALALRACGKDGQAWYILGLALRLAMSLGLHKSVETPQQRGLPPNSSASLRRRLWWSCFSLERLLQLENGRPSSIDSTQDYGSLDANLTIRLPGFGLWRPGQTSDSDSSPNSDEQDHHVVSPEEAEAYDLPEQRTNRLFTAWVSLSAIMGQISDRFYNHRFGHATELLGETARLAQCLTKWEASLPPSLKPGSSSFAGNVDHAHVAIAFLAQQYYHAKMAVLRIAILFPPQGFQKEVQKRALELADIGQLLGAASQCVGAARSLIHLNLQLADSGIHSTLVGVQQIFLASIVLALSILRSPRSRLVRSDVELLTEATSHVESCYESWGYPAAFLTIFSRLRDRTTAISRGQALPIAPLSSLIANGNAAMQAKSRVASAHHSRRTSHIHGSQAWIGEAATPAGREDILLSDEQSQEPTHHQTEACSKEVHAEHSISASLFANSNGLDGSNAGSGGVLPFTSETGMEAFTSMDFEDFWDMLKADIFM